MTNNESRTHVDATKVTDAATLVALDALASRHPEAHKLLIGIGCTVSIGSDDYAAKIVACSASLYTITVAREHFATDLTFRWSVKHDRYVCRKHYFLNIGEARDYRDPSF